MSTVNGVGGGNPVQNVNKAAAAGKAEATDASARPAATDRLELSGASHLLKSLKSNDVRLDKVAGIRAQLEAGTYEDDAKLTSAADKLLDDINNG